MIKNRRERIAQVTAYLEASGLDCELRHLDENTATAASAASALGCAVACIAKSIVFRAGDTAVVAVLCGDDRVNPDALSAVVERPLDKADAAFVQHATGFEIGGVPPVSHGSDVIVCLESRMQNHPRMWAAAGSAYTVFGFAPPDLSAVIRADFCDFAQ